ncbi:MAG: hypothetical protein BroJett013_30170 [Alphaproteobacteria bacterium]|nr:MAG: hypothetical protein BroJett013_30170 [Alphaproteobacteria bacterium]
MTNIARYETPPIAPASTARKHARRTIAGASGKNQCGIEIGIMVGASFNSPLHHYIAGAAR